MSDRGFTNPNVGSEVRISSLEKANSLADNILDQLKAGALNLTLMGKPISVESDRWRRGWRR